MFRLCGKRKFNHIRDVHTEIQLDHTQQPRIRVHDPGATSGHCSFAACPCIDENNHLFVEVTNLFRIGQHQGGPFEVHVLCDDARTIRFATTFDWQPGCTLILGRSDRHPLFIEGVPLDSAVCHEGKVCRNVQIPVPPTFRSVTFYSTLTTLQGPCRTAIGAFEWAEHFHGKFWDDWFEQRANELVPLMHGFAGMLSLTRIIARYCYA